MTCYAACVFLISCLVYIVRMSSNAFAERGNFEAVYTIDETGELKRKSFELK